MSFGGAGPSSDLVAQVENIIRKASSGNADRPTDKDLGPVFTYLIPQDHAAGGYKSTYTHWYCHRTPSELVRRAATYLLFIFAFRREGTSKVWVDSLETVVKTCDGCAATFGSIRKEFGKT